MAHYNTVFFCRCCFCRRLVDAAGCFHCVYHKIYTQTLIEQKGEFVKKKKKKIEMKEKAKTNNFKFLFMSKRDREKNETSQRKNEQTENSKKYKWKNKIG